MKTEIICNFLNESCLNLFLNAHCFIKSKHIGIFSLISTNLAEIIFSPMINVMHLFFRKQNTKWMKIDPCLVGNKMVSIQASGWPPNDGLDQTELSYHYTAMMFNVENVILKKKFWILLGTVQPLLPVKSNFTRNIPILIYLKLRCRTIGEEKGKKRLMRPSHIFSTPDIMMTFLACSF